MLYREKKFSIGFSKIANDDRPDLFEFGKDWTTRISGNGTLQQRIARTSSTAREMWKLLEPICDKVADPTALVVHVDCLRFSHGTVPEGNAAGKIHELRYDLAHFQILKESLLMNSGTNPNRCSEYFDCNQRGYRLVMKYVPAKRVTPTLFPQS